jgi:hypothetical protein
MIHQSNVRALDARSARSSKSPGTGADDDEIVRDSVTQRTYRAAQASRRAPKRCTDSTNRRVPEECTRIECVLALLP